MYKNYARKTSNTNNKICLADSIKIGTFAADLIKYCK